MNEQVQIRAAKPSDAKDILLVAANARRQAYRNLIPNDRLKDFNDSLQIAQKNIDWWRAKIQKSIDSPTKRVAKVLLLNGKVVGFYCSKVKAGAVHVTNLYVDPSAQGKGFGKQLLHSGLQAAAFSKVWLHVLADNHASVAFYKKFGFKVDSVSDKTYYGAKRYKMVLMP